MFSRLAAPSQKPCSATAWLPRVSSGMVMPRRPQRFSAPTPSSTAITCCSLHSCFSSSPELKTRKLFLWSTFKVCSVQTPFLEIQTSAWRPSFNGVTSSRALGKPKASSASLSDRCAGGGGCFTCSSCRGRAASEFSSSMPSVSVMWTAYSVFQLLPSHTIQPRACVGQSTSSLA